MKKPMFSWNIDEFAELRVIEERTSLDDFLDRGFDFAENTVNKLSETSMEVKRYLERRQYHNNKTKAAISRVQQRGIDTYEFKPVIKGTNKPAAHSFNPIHEKLYKELERGVPFRRPGEDPVDYLTRILEQADLYIEALSGDILVASIRYDFVKKLNIYFRMHETEVETKPGSIELFMPKLTDLRPIIVPVPERKHK